MPDNIKSNLNVIAGAAFAILVFFQIGETVRAVRYGPFSTILAILLCIVYAGFAVCLFMKRRDQLLLGAIGVLLLVQVLYLTRVVGPVFVIRNMFYIAATAAIGLLLLSQLYESLSSYRTAAKSMWYIPAALYAIAIIISFFAAIYYMRNAPTGVMLQTVASTIFFAPLIVAAGYLCLSWWIVTPEAAPANDEFAVAGGSADAPGSNPPPSGNPGGAPRPNPNSGAPRPAPSGDGYCSLLMHVVLLVFTGGIWYMIWIYRTTGYLNRVAGEPYRDPVKKLLLCLFVPFYLIYWVYQSARRVDLLAAEHGVHSDLTTFCLVLAFFVGIMPPAFMQEKINTISMVENGYNPNSGGAPNANASSANVAEEIKAYKDLLDSGAITQEDYDAKKRTLLGV